MPTGSISALRLFARRAIAAFPSLTGSACRDPPSSFHHTQVLLGCSGSGSRRWLAQEAPRHGGHKYRNRTKNFKREPKEEKVPPPSWIDVETSSVSFAPEELVPGPAMVERIVKELKEAGNTFILPVGNEEVMEQVVEPFRRLESIGVKGEFIARACIARPELFKLIATKGDQTIKVLSRLVEICGLSYEDCIRLAGNYPEIVTQGDNATHLALEAIIACGVPASRTLGYVVKRCPPLLFARPADEIREAAEALRDFFSRKQITMIIQRCPQVLLKSMQETEEKYEYIFYQMGLQGEEFTECARWGSMRLEDIIERHEFLMKCGRFRMPDQKRPQAKAENPTLSQILDSRDDIFASQVANVSREEWVIYRALCVKQSELSSKDRPFERVKPSLRKAYERRRKETPEVEDHVFDVSANSCL